METASLIDTYCRAWSEPDPAERARLLHEVWSPAGTYTDPTVRTEGIAQLLDHIAQVQRRRPGSKVVRTSRIDEHHGMVRFAWCAIEAGGNRLPEGLDIAFLRADGRQIETVLGFFGPLKGREGDGEGRDA